MGKKLTIEEITNEYGSKFESLQQLDSELKKQLEKLVQGTGVKLGFPIYGRVKKIDSIVKKQESGSFTIKKSIKELQDLVGFRIILLFKKDIEKVIDLLHQNLNVIKQYDTQNRLDNDQFGYSSIHLVATIPVSWYEVPVFDGLGDIVVEVQIRTLAQHTWAECSHLIDYKDDYEIPAYMKRSISRASALLETVDLDFEKLVKEREEFIKKMTSDHINSTNLESLLSTFMSDEYKTGSENYEEAVQILQEKGFSEKEKVESLIQKNLERALEYDQGLAQAIIDNNGENDSVNYQGKDYSTRDLNKIKQKKTYGSQTFLLGYMLSQELTKSMES
ncbi:hypothetical protein [uncultured Psychroserpens sp.]|uniref:GTP pyrophosphokinase n=1 Tax=uncultured Psychroserpens sp. TaxID=255436 RepID=UPI002625E81D|nr:hypothetical protein [uncultured Psychroserpens sp.]